MKKHSNSDIEKETVVGVVQILSMASAYHQHDSGEVILNTGLKAGLKNRMVNLIALCGIIGPGVFLGFGNMLVASGPAGMLASFAIVGILVIICKFDFGELNGTYDANFAILGSRFICKGFGAALSLSFVVLWITNEVSEYTPLYAAMSVYTDKIPMYGCFLLLWGFFTCF
jgi:amino acid transporter